MPTTIYFKVRGLDPITVSEDPLQVEREFDSAVRYDRENGRLSLTARVGNAKVYVVVGTIAYWKQGR
jgi:hypothetical protein